MKEPVTPREDVLFEAAELIVGDRNKTYGSPTENFQDTADVWNVILRPKLKDGEKITPGEVASLMIALKLVRQIAQPKRDNWVDIAGYAGCGHEVDVETGRIVENWIPIHETNTSWGKRGDEILVTDQTAEPAVSVLEEVEEDSDRLNWYLVKVGDQWNWSNSTKPDARYVTAPWHEIIARFFGVDSKIFRVVQ